MNSPNRTWSLSDFQKPSRRSRNYARKPDADDEENDDQRPASDDRREALSNLVCEFVDYARHQEGVPYTKAALARDNLWLYIRKRHAGELEQRPSLLETAMRPQRKPKVKPRVLDHLLCPDRDTLDRYCRDLLHFMNPQHYDIAAMFELIPAWLRFLETVGLIDPKQRETTLGELRGMQADLLRLWEGGRTDPALVENLQRWHETAQRPTLLPAGQ